MNTGKAIVLNLWQFVLIGLLFGCTVGPKYEPPEMDLPSDWHSEPSEGMDASSPECFLWWENLNDPILDSLIDRASLQNLDLFIAATRVLQARLERKGKSAENYPHLDGSAAFGNVYYSKDALINGVLGSVSPACKKHVKRSVNFFEIGFDAEWEIDLFGMTRREVAALQAKVEASEESLCDLWITLSAEIARNYVELRGFQKRLELGREILKNQEESVQLLNDLLQIGMASMPEFHQAEEQFNTLAAEQPLIELSIDKAIHRLSILIGSEPGELFAELCAPQELPILPCEKPIGIPSELLRRRPDIRKAERELAAATEMVGSAVAQLFPRLSLTGFVGDISTHLGSLTRQASATTFGSPQLLLPIFNSRMIVQDIKYNKLKVKEACYEYQKAVLLALEETENAIASFHYEMERSGYLGKALQADHDAYDLSKLLYERGLKGYQDVLMAQRAVLAAEDHAVKSQVDLLLHYISLYKALGGGWDLCQ